MLLADPLFDVRPDGTVWTLVTRTGKTSVSNTWRLAGAIKDGYVEISYYYKKLRVHRIVYAKFNGELSDDLVVNHKDGIRGNNHPENLELTTQSQNNYHRYRELRKPP